MKMPTSLVDGNVAGSRMLTCNTPKIPLDTTAKVTFEWSGGDAVSLFAGSNGANTLYSASWYTGITLVKGRPIVSGLGFSATGKYQCEFNNPTVLYPIYPLN
jgi:hypothetical protein